MKYSLIVGGFLLLSLPGLASAAQVSSSVSVNGDQATITIQSDTSIPNAIVDAALYYPIPGPLQLGAQAFLNVNIPIGSISCTWNVPAGGSYIKIGVFSSDWSTLYNWNDNAAAIGGPLTGSNALTCGEPFATPPTPAWFIPSNALPPPVASTTITSSATAVNGATDPVGFFAATVTVHSNQSIPNAIIDAEGSFQYTLTNGEGKPFQFGGRGKAYATVNIPANEDITCTIYGEGLVAFPTVPSPTKVTLQVGVFSANWDTNYSWNPAAGTIASTAISIPPGYQMPVSYPPLPLPPTVCSVAGGVSPPATTTPPTTSTGQIDQNGQTVRAGTTIDFSGRNFGHEESVIVSLNGAIVATAHADGGGNFSTGSLSVPTTVGTYTYTFTGQTSGITGSATITVIP